MARIFDNTLAQYLNRGGAVLSGLPMTFSCWFWLNAGSSNPVLMALGDAASTGAPSFDLIYTGGDSKIHAEHAGSVDDDTAASTIIAPINQWCHGCAVYASATSRSCYLNGANKGTSVVSVTSTGTLNESRIANLALNLTGFTLNGRIAFPAIWNVALSDAEVAALGQGVSPKLIRPSALKSYLRMSGGNSPEPDFKGGTWTLVGAPGVTPNAIPLFGP